MSGSVAQGSSRGPAEPAFVEQVQDELARLWDSTTEVGPGERAVFELAVVEAVTNSVRHSRPLDGSGPVVLEFRVEVAPGRLLARIAELNAQSFLPDEQSPRLPGDEAETGRGLALLERLLSRCAHEAGADGNVWTLELERSGPERE